jgi:prepilin-type N-terminal cleavage/methylation domain-containing protein
MKRGFTLLEIIVVIIIIGVLATLGFMQYSAVIEKARGAEAKATIGALRTQLAALALERGENTSVGASDIGIGSGIPGPSSCAGTNYFRYNVGTGCTAGNCTLTATRCTSGGKNPNAASSFNGSISLTYSSSGTDNWTSTGGY